MFGRKKTVVVEFEGKQYELRVGDTLIVLPKLDILGGDVKGTLTITKTFPVKVVSIQ